MKLVFILISVGHTEYVRQSWKSILTNMNAEETTEDDIEARAAKSWGQPIDDKYRAFTDCPTLALPLNADRFFCDLATCAVDCKPGFLPQGQSRTHCREFKGKLAWTKELVLTRKHYKIMNKAKNFFHFWSRLKLA